MSSIKRHHWNPLTLTVYVSIDFSFKKTEDTQSRVDESKFFVSFIHNLQGWSYLEEGRREKEKVGERLQD